MTVFVLPPRLHTARERNVVSRAGSVLLLLATFGDVGVVSCRRPGFVRGARSETNVVVSLGVQSSPMLFELTVEANRNHTTADG